MKLFSLFSMTLASSLLYASPSSENRLLNKGNEVASALLQKLGSELKGKMQSSGPMGALDFCSQNALILTEEVAKNSQTSIKRISINNRNPLNKANDNETTLLTEWSKLSKNGQPLPSHSIVNLSENSSIYYKPIIINNETCLKCHGNVESDLAKAIAVAYPEDKATGYKMGDLRGMIAVTIEH